jgi:Uma2 family endonuclease
MSALSPPIKTLADLLHQLGDIPLDRIRFHPAPGTATKNDVIEAEARENVLCELINGVLVEKAVGFRESGLAMFVGIMLDAFVRPRNLGLVTGADSTMELMPGLVRIPDVAYTRWDRMPQGRCPDDPIPAIAPNLAVEVLSRSNTRAEMKAKRLDYFSAGVELVWEIDPVAREVMVYISNSILVTLTAADVLDGGTVLPGFAVPVRDLFAELDRHG